MARQGTGLTPFVQEMIIPRCAGYVVEYGLPHAGTSDHRAALRTAAPAHKRVTDTNMAVDGLT